MRRFPDDRAAFEFIVRSRWPEYRRLLFAFDGILVTDRYSVYRVHDTEKRQLCWAHYLDHVVIRSRRERPRVWTSAAA